MRKLFYSENLRPFCWEGWAKSSYRLRVSNTSEGGGAFDGGGGGGSGLGMYGRCYMMLYGAVWRQGAVRGAIGALRCYAI